MAVVLIEEDDLKALIRSAVEEGVAGIKTNDLPPFMRRQEFMDFMGIGSAKANELFKRKGFPVTWEFGHPRVITSLLVKWAEDNSEWVDKHAGDEWKRRREAM
ncbi:hypothetical protein [Paenibacillus durus]|uniref:DNA-binding protein n=1 Tax=Paenibacillus durus ATCC 35681 TaxID=1333534 RepID=A0A0F7FCQ3_PAEDU|nr:hypothetical protein [Paenibacillus durus]AKG36138.1 hypothetical protein VK70_17520 [Paenibacillus durus ATCC 35681]